MAEHDTNARPGISRARLAHIAAWSIDLPGDEADRACAGIVEKAYARGACICPKNTLLESWTGVVAGLIKIGTVSPEGRSVTFTGVPAGGWFGEGTVLKGEVYRYNIQALRKSVVAGITAGTFHWLLDRSIGFNRFVMNQLNERLGQFIGAREIDRLTHPDERVARSLAALFHPVLYPGVGDLLRITQQELGYLVGLSRQRVNEALTALQTAGVIQVEYGGVRVLDLERLRSYRTPDGHAN